MQLSSLSLKKGTTVRKSVRGANGFYYPSTTERIVVTEACDATRHTGWLTFSGYVPVVVPSSIFDLGSRYDSKEKMIVWVEGKRFHNNNIKRS